MKIINSKIHGFLDYVVVAFLLVSPHLFNLPATTSLFTYILAGIHFVLTVLTNFELGLFKVVPFEVHGTIEVVVSILLVIAAFVLGVVDNSLARNFYLGIALVVFLTWLFTDYGSFKRYW
ncbi:hypothetical protein [Flavobacterium sp. UBA7682]|uniref:hypothetical protein n=1 Tax=Flavobacterium sp. UBA7682 TaxID=1946560 RepID=UPI0025BFD86C|nr:hypothetical protein [Flavobacterium sp. UBA7682]